MEQFASIENLGVMVADHIPAMMAYWDKELICRFANNAYLDWFGKSKDEMVNKMHLVELLGQPLFEKNLPYIKQVLEGKDQQFERDIEIPLGNIRHTIANYYPDLQNGTVRGFFVYVADVTKHKKLEQELSLSEKKFKNLLENAPDSTVIVTKDGYIELVNGQTEKLFGISSEELIGKKIETLIPERFRNNHRTQHLMFFLNPNFRQMASGLEIFGLHKNGEEFPVEISISPIELEDGLHVSASIRDISQRKEHEKEINEMATIIASTSDAIISKDLNGIILTWNKGAEKILGYKHDEIKGKHISILVPPELSKEEDMLLSKIVSGESVEQYKTIRVRKDKARINVSITLSPLKNKSGKIVGISKILRDITQQKKAEKETQSLLDLATLQNARLKNFAYIVSHNLRSHSSNVSMLLDMFIKRTPEVADNRILQHVKIASDSLNDTIDNLNEVALMNTKTEQNVETIHLGLAIESAINGVFQLINEAGVSIINQVSKDVTVLGIPAYIDSILLNFITNGIKYRSPDRQGVIILSAIQQNNEVVLSIKDNGVGIDMKKHGDKLFGMYKTFHGNKDARGIGLFITKNQIEAIGGKVEVESKLNNGTTFKIFFKHE